MSNSYFFHFDLIFTTFRENNYEVINEIRRFANPLFNCHGLSRSGNNNTQWVSNGVEAPSTRPTHYRRSSHAHRRQTYQRMSSQRSSFDRSSMYDYAYENGGDAASTVTAPAFAPRFDPHRRASTASMTAMPMGRMFPSISDYNLYLAQQQQQHQQQPAMKRQRTSEYLYHNEPSPKSLAGDQWATYRQGWEEMSDCSAPISQHNASFTQANHQTKLYRRHLFNKNVSASGAHPYSRRALPQQQSMYSTSPCSTHSLSFLEQHLKASKISPDQPNPPAAPAMAMDQQYSPAPHQFQVPAVPMAPASRDYYTNQSPNGYHNVFDFSSAHQQGVPNHSCTVTEYSTQDDWSLPQPVQSSLPVCVAEPEHESLARKESMKKVQQWLQTGVGLASQMQKKPTTTPSNLPQLSNNDLL